MHSSRMRTIYSSSHLLGGVPGPRGVYLVWEVYLVPDGVPGRGESAQVLPHCGQTHMCKNITFATSLQMVIKSKVIFVTYLVWCGGKGWL